jgi:hypothetical protein
LGKVVACDLRAAFNQEFVWRVAGKIFFSKWKLHSLETPEPKYIPLKNQYSTTFP